MRPQDKASKQLPSALTARSAVRLQPTPRPTPVGDSAHCRGDWRPRAKNPISPSPTAQATLYSQDSHSRQHGVCVCVERVVVVCVNRETVRVVATRVCVARFRVRAFCGLVFLFSFDVAVLSRALLAREKPPRRRHSVAFGFFPICTALWGDVECVCM